MGVVGRSLQNTNNNKTRKTSGGGNLTMMTEKKSIKQFNFRSLLVLNSTTRRSFSLAIFSIIRFLTHVNMQDLNSEL